MPARPALARGGVMAAVSAVAEPRAWAGPGQLKLVTHATLSRPRGGEQVKDNPFGLPTLRGQALRFCLVADINLRPVVPVATDPQFRDRGAPKASPCRHVVTSDRLGLPVRFGLGLERSARRPARLSGQQAAQAARGLRHRSV